MSKKQLQKDIRAFTEFVITEGSLNPKHLLAVAYDLIQLYKLRGARCGISDLKASIMECYSFRDSTSRENARSGLLWSEVYHGRAELGDSALSPHIVWDDCTTFFESISPSGYYFGSLEGDDACIGWFQYTKEVAQ